MKNVDVIRAWKDEDYRNSLSAEQLSALPANPAGELSDLESERIAGGDGDTSSYPVCPPITSRLTGLAGCDECDYK